jgi:hypothetical protein
MPLPAQHVNDAWGSAEFYANKLLMQYRGTDERQVEWVKGVKVSLNQGVGLVCYIVTSTMSGVQLKK